MYKPLGKLHDGGLSLWDALRSHSASLCKVCNKEFPSELWTIVFHTKGRDLTLRLLLTLLDPIQKWVYSSSHGTVHKKKF